MKKYITLIALFLGQGLTGTVISLLTLISVLIGNSLSPYSFLSTLPITTTILGSAIMAYLASNIMEYYGRKKSFIIGGLIGLVGSLIAIIAIIYTNFILFCASTFILGCSTVFNQFYRFAAADISNDPVFIKRSTSIIISGGILGGILGPYFAVKGIDLIENFKFIGNFVLTSIIFLLLIFTQLFLSFKEKKIILNNSIAIVVRENVTEKFIIGTISCAVGFSLMTLIMNAAPLSMHNHNYTVHDSSLALQFHFFAMYSPSLILPFIIKKIKTNYLILVGSLCYMLGALFCFFSNNYLGYLVSLVCAGIGWAFMFNGGTFYLNEIKHTQNKHKLQGKSALITYIANLIASFSIGALISMQYGWLLVNAIVILFCVIFILIFNKL
ncbi:MFS transporter, partial [Pasteurellaceae bacterium 15-036681]